MTSEKAFDLCLKLMNTIKDKAEKEHEFYRLGEDCFNNKVFMEEKERDLSAIFGQDYKRIRYHHLVRLGGDITRSVLFFGTPTIQFKKYSLSSNLISKQAKIHVPICLKSYKYLLNYQDF